MTAQDVHTIAKALPKEEYVRLYTIINEALKPLKPKTKNHKKPIISDFEAQQYLFKSIFSKEAIERRLNNKKS